MPGLMKVVNLPESMQEEWRKPGETLVKFLYTFPIL